MKSILTAIRASVFLMLLCGLIYPLITTGVAKALFPKQAEGSLLESNGAVHGSALLAQNFTSPRNFHPRASAAKYDPTASAGSNVAVASDDYIKGIKKSITEVKKENPALTGSIPPDLVTSSGSGFDPDLSPEAAKAQVPRIARSTGIPEGRLIQLIDEHIKGRSFGLFGEPRVNVLELNSALQQIR